MTDTHIKPSISINKHECQIYFLRHAESMANIGEKILDSPLSKNGIIQAKNISGDFDLILVSPLRRTLETLHYSSILGDKIIIVPELREIIQDISSILLLEQRTEFKEETLKSFWNRAESFTHILEKYCQEIKKGKILIVGHAFFFNGWYTRLRADVSPIITHYSSFFLKKR